MRFVPESHKQQFVPHSDTFCKDNLLPRGQEIAEDVAEHDAPGSNFAMLVRGTDSCKNWINVAPQSTLFGQGEMKLYDDILNIRKSFFVLLQKKR